MRDSRMYVSHLPQELEVESREKEFSRESRIRGSGESRYAVKFLLYRWLEIEE